MEHTNKNIKDSYPRYLFTLDPLLQRREGVHHCNLMDFVANGEDLRQLVLGSGFQPYLQTTCTT